ncbi:sodium/hydrogen exchanger 4 [Forsythia ovata]|uniref:Sodium/hydrogen exchanger 4 n=1 Tax=Forsythia ovata TaxID=205694 RepID=A0ABD1Q9R8_9LAMI
MGKNKRNGQRECPTVGLHSTRIFKARIMRQVPLLHGRSLCPFLSHTVAAEYLIQEFHLRMGIADFAINIGESHKQVVPITIFVAVLCFCLVIGHLLGESRWFNESITALLIGCLTGTVILLISKWKSSQLLRFDEELFFIYLLPPIIFNAGFQVKKKQFFHNFFTIMLFGVVGVFISSSIITAGSWLLFPKFGFTGLTARDYLGIGTIFSSTDTVCTLQVLHQEETPLLYSLVFGEGVVNDATSVVLFNAIQKIDVNRIDGWTAVHIFVDFLYLFSTSTALGVAAGLFTAYILKGLYFGRHSTVREIALTVLMAYLSYMLAEDFSTYEGEPSLQSQNTSKSQTKSKLQARRSKKNTKSSSQDQPPPADFHFMPTPGIEQSNAAVFDNYGPAVDAPVRSRHEKD